MRATRGRVTKIQLDSSGSRSAWIACPAQAIPSPGRYLLAASPEEIVPVALFSAEKVSQGFLAAPPVPHSWTPGTALQLHGPLGRGFALPGGLKRLALAALGESISRLVPLVSRNMLENTAVALFTDAPLPSLPSALEINPLDELPRALVWADFLALDMKMETLTRLREILDLREDHLPCPGQALIITAMPCGGIADCGVCAVPVRRSWKLTCKDGPVFNLNELEW